MRLEWTRPALLDIREAGEFISRDNPDAAERVAERIVEAVEYLRDYPALGRPGRLPETKELVVTGTPFIIVYRARGSAVQILRVLHHARKWPSEDSP